MNFCRVCGQLLRRVEEGLMEDVPVFDATSGLERRKGAESPVRPDRRRQ